MITLPRCLRAAGVMMILVSLGVGGDRPGITPNANRFPAAPPCDDRRGQQPGGLEMRRPYERGKVPVVLIHGLWGKPQLWERMVEALEADPALRRRYQFWTFRYASGDAIPYSAHLLRQSLLRARRGFDPDGTDPAFDGMVVVGHSLGGILAKMMVQSSGSRLWQTICARTVDQVAGPPEDCRLLQQAFCYKPVPEVRRVVFIATPHRGSPLASGPLRGLGTRLCGRPSRFVQALQAVLANNEPDLFTPEFLEELPTSAGELASGHRLLMGLCGLGIEPSIRSHSIIADLRDPPGPGATDGIIPYSSSHLEGVDSELVVRGLHICLDHPAVIREVRRILMEHAGIDAAPRTDPGGLARPGLLSARERWTRRRGFARHSSDTRSHPLISTEHGMVAVRVIRTDEESMIARAAAELLTRARAAPGHDLVTFFTSKIPTERPTPLTPMEESRDGDDPEGTGRGRPPAATGRPGRLRQAGGP